MDSMDELKAMLHAELDRMVKDHGLRNMHDLKEYSMILDNIKDIDTIKAMEHAKDSEYDK
jgi:hypothetical protein